MRDEDDTTQTEAGRDERARRFLDWLTDPTASNLEGPALAAAATALAERNLERAGGPDLLDGIACRRGCAHCCRLPVLTTAPEVERALAWLRARVDPPALDALAERAAAAASAYRDGVHPPDPPRHPDCPFLERDECLVHPVRPLACRAWNSVDVDACRRAREGAAGVAAVPARARLRAVHANVAEALARGLVARGGDAPEYLVPALAARLRAAAS